MEIVNVLAAAVAAFAFGAVWYITMNKPWVAAAEVRLDDKGNPTRSDGSSAGPLPYIVGLVAMVLVAGMMRHMLATSGVTTVGGGAVAGLGVGAFLITPWVAMNYGFAMRKPALTLIDGVNSVVGCTIMGAVLNAF
ncbi:DUF1761 domain-containing protein [Tabrizicola sp.]|uniref:DUF1761 domain-containing protein n=1 Tax=Tabrizicola sp. TaxID=2005166 RepID=UPI003F397657